MAFQFLCPQGHLLQGDESQAGQRCQCPYCGTEFLIPAPLSGPPADTSQYMAGQMPAQQPAATPPYQAPPQQPEQQPPEQPAPQFMQQPPGYQPPGYQPPEQSFVPPVEQSPFPQVGPQAETPPATFEQFTPHPGFAGAEPPIPPVEGPGQQEFPSFSAGPGFAADGGFTAPEEAEPSFAPVTAEAQPMLHIVCPNGHVLETPREMVGQDALCPFCQVQFNLRFEDSQEYRHEQEIERQRREQAVANAWLKWSIVAAVVVVLGVIVMIVLASTARSPRRPAKPPATESTPGSAPAKKPASTPNSETAPADSGSQPAATPSAAPSTSAEPSAMLNSPASWVLLAACQPVPNTGKQAASAIRGC